ncbi:MAG: cobalamin biosynthesis protein CobW [Flavobacteriales bacterium]|nr:cobalamin biosynthesis protein CobW [Flavobacteriales bacterium]
MEMIITIVGFLGAGKTTLLKTLMTKFLEEDWKPFIILNDYENAHLDAQQFIEQMNPKWVRALSGSCICCSGLHELRNLVNLVPAREKGITLIEANGTSDACSLMGFLGVGLDDRFMPPIQISAVDVKNWQKRKEHNELEANQIQLSSIIVLTHVDDVTDERKDFVIRDIERFNPLAKIVIVDEVDVTKLTQVEPSKNKAEKLEHQKAHWSSCSTDLPNLPDEKHIHAICKFFPKGILRVKGCVRVGDDENYTYFERTPDGKVSIRPFNGFPPMGAKLLTIGLGSEKSLLKKAIANALSSQ